MSVLKINSHGIDFNVRILYEGDTYGLNEQFMHNKSNPLVEFYDTRYQHTQYGQLISRYDLNTLLEREENFGLNLDGGIPDWYIDSTSMNMVTNWLEANQKKPAPKKKI